MSSKRTLWTIAYLTFGVVAFSNVSRYITEPYMDEYFHVRQTLQYTLDHDFWTWDPKITTPPGLYILGFLASSLAGPDLVVLRSVNALALPILSWFVAPDPLVAMGFPLLAFFSNLYYTDVWSTLLVLGGFRATCAWTSATLLFASLWFRQTNIVWAGLVAAFRIAQSTQVSELWAKKHELFRRLLAAAVPYGSLALAFAGFLHWNGSITLGDQSNHEVSVHGAQALYFMLFTAAFSAPLALQWMLSRRALRRLWLLPIEVAAIYAIVRYGTIEHPFILADNRHYTFYMWRRLITPCRGLLLVPCYWVSWHWLLHTLDFADLNTWAFVGATLAVLIPSPLLEPRYYIVPYLVWRLFLYKRPGSSWEYAWYLAINIATVAVFCRSQTHFMW